MDQPAPNQSVVTKTEFAELCNVTGGRVSQWISEGKITGQALVGKGRQARINVAVATNQLNGTLDEAQRNGLNGIATILADHDQSGSRLSGEIQAERLEGLKLKNQEGREKELARRGTYLLASDVEVEVSKVTTTILKAIEGSLPDMANALAEKLEISQRDVLHVLRDEFLKARQSAADQLIRLTTAAPEIIEDQDNAA